MGRQNGVGKQPQRIPVALSIIRCLTLHQNTQPGYKRFCASVYVRAIFRA
jgi:hypothetical protein